MSDSRMKLVATSFLVFLLIIVCLPCFSQKVSQKKDISLFKLSYYKFNIPNEALGSIDEQIKSVFINLGRFNILGMTYRIADEDVNQFIEKIKEFKQANTEISESFKMGHEVFTEKDLNQLVSSFIVVIPTVAYFNTVQEKKTLEYETTFKTSFTFVDVEKGTTFAQFFVEGTGKDKDRLASMQHAVESIPAMLEFEISKIFTIETGILEVKGGEVVIQLGKDMGIKQGYEFEMIDNKILNSGVKMQESNGLIIIKDVQQEVSFGNVIYGNAQEGGQLKEIPRVGVEAIPYVDVMIDLANGGTIFSVLGIRTVVAKGFYNIRPFVGVEVPMPFAINEPSERYFGVPLLFLWGVPVNAYVGCQFPLYLGPLVIAPELAIGAGGFYPYEGYKWDESDNQVITHFGGFANANISYYFHRDFKATIDLGYKIWWAPTDVLFTSLLGSGLHFTYSGIMIGAGITAKL